MKKQKQKNKSWPYFRLPAPFLFFLVIVYSLAIYFMMQEKTVVLPDQLVPIRLYSNQAGDDIRSTFKHAIMGAKESIYCLIYSLTDDEIIDALKQKADEGVHVFVVADSVATQDAEAKLGSNVHFFKRRQKGLMHNKLLAIDHEVCLIGSANFTRDSLSLHANLVMGIVAPIVASNIEEKANDLAIKRNRKIEPLVLATPEQTFEMSFLPDDQKALNKVRTSILSAQKTVKVAMFTFTHPALIDALVETHKRGVKVQIVIDNDSSRKTSSIAYNRFLKEKMDVLVSKRAGLLHEKVAIIDDNLLIMGSANWTKAAFTQNSENICFLQGLTGEQQKKLSDFWATTLREAS